MVKRHKYVQNEFNDSDIIWKYYKLPRFLDLLYYQKLYFTRVDKFSDPNEFPITQKDARAFHMGIDIYQKEFNRIKQQTYVNCWRVDNNESFGMWSAYANIETGIAIKTTAGRLIASCNDIAGGKNITIGKVRYIDEKTEMVQVPGMPLNVFYNVFAKTKPYEYENELRLAFEDSTNKDKEYQSIDINLCTLIEEIRVGAMAHPLFVRMVDGVLKETDINVPVIKSKIK